ncbi:MAG: hypothetical protein ACI4V7_04035 [Succinivibrionaceae bacterium]
MFEKSIACIFQTPSINKIESTLNFALGISVFCEVKVFIFRDIISYLLTDASNQSSLKMLLKKMQMLELYDIPMYTNYVDNPLVLGNEYKLLPIIEVSTNDFFDLISKTDFKFGM